MKQESPHRRPVKRVVGVLLGALLAIPMYGVAVTPAVAATDENPSFYLNANDLDFILRQIQISEAHAAGGQLLCPTPTDKSGKCVASPKLPHGLRTVDGSFNNLTEGRSLWGASDQPFPTILEPYFRQADPALTAPGAPPAGNTDMCEPGLTCYAQWEPGHIVYDSTPRIISNLIVDQSTNNPAAVNAASHLPGSEIRPDGTIHLPNMASDEGLSAPTNAFFTFFGQFFDHGLDLVDKGGNGTLIVPLQEDDPIRDHPDFNPQAPYLVLTRATRQPGPDGVLGTNDDTHNNETTPFVDQNQTYTSHPSHQVFLRKYEIAEGAPIDTGELLDAPSGGLVTWTDIKNQARDVLGIELTDKRALDVPQVVTDPYGNFIPGPNGFPLVVTDNGGEPLNVEGNLGTPVNADLALTTGHAFLEDIAHGATPVVVGGELMPRFDEEGNPVLDDSGNPVLSGYDNVSLGAHFVTGDGRGNENIGLSTVHHVFHAEHNRMVGSVMETLDANPELKKAYQGLEHAWPNERPEDVLPGPEADDWNYPQRVFQAARFATEMQYQHLVFEEFARTVQPSIDAVVFNENSYNANIDPSITAEFAHVVYRFGHSMLTDEIERSGFDTTKVELLEGFLNPAAYTDNGRLSAEQAAGSIVNGTVRQQSSQIDEFVVGTLRNNLLGLPLDLPTINMLRARDAGVPPLQEARQTFFDATGDPMLRPYANWVDFGDSLKNGNIFGRDATNASLVNFVAAYGTHESILAETTIDGKREAASLLVNGTPLGDEAFISRLAGGTAFDTAVLISESNFSPNVPVVYLTTNENFPDALAAGPLAAAGPGPLLLTGKSVTPTVTINELIRLNPAKIVVLGGELAVRPSVVDQLERADIAPVERMGGTTLYDTAVLISQQLITADGGADTVYVATGENFPDALAASTVAARDGDPILLTRKGQLPPVTRAELERLDPDRVIVLGGTSAVTAGVFNAIVSAVPGATVERVWGQTQYDTAAEISSVSYPAGHGGTLYITTGGNFLDGLAVGPVGGLNDRPVLLVPHGNTTGVTSIPASVMAEIERLQPDHIVVLGGPLAVNPDVDIQLGAFAPPIPTEVPEDRVEYMLSTGAYTNVDGKTVTGLENVDFWTGGLAERVNPFGGLLGSSFNFVFEEQLEALQFGDRFYYLFRNQGNQLFAALEANSFSSLIERNTDASELPANIFSIQDPVISLANVQQPYPGTLRQDPDDTWRWVGDEHIEIHGTSGDDRIRTDEGDDSVSGKGGNDIIEGGSGNDVLAGGEGNDVLTDTFGDDVLKGQWGNDVLHSGPGFDIVHGGPGHDYLVNGGDTDNMFAGDGNDVILGSTGRIVAAFGGEQNDWLEGSRHADLLQGDNGDQFQADVIGGDDVVIGRGGDDDIEGEGGDDILVAEVFGTDRHLGNMGWDWVTYYGETQDVDADFLFTLLQRPDVNAVRDRFDQLEGLSGGSGDDVLRGPNRAVEGEFAGDEEYLHKMTEDTLDLVDGLREMLYPDGMNFGQQFMREGPIADSDGFPSIVIGGEGSDLIEGRFGNDYLDGDAYLAVQLALVDAEGNVLEAHDSASAYQARMLAGEIDPGNLQIIREIRYDDPASGAIDVSEYADVQSAYTVTYIKDSYWQVEHTGAVEAEESSGIDIINNIERLQFLDSCVILDSENGTMAPCEPVGEIVLTFEDPLNEGTNVVAELLDNEGNAFDLSEATNVRYTWFGGEGGSPAEITEIEELTIGGVAPDPGTPNMSTYVPTDDAVEQYLQVNVKFEIDGTLYTVVSPWTTLAVVNVNDPGVPPAIVGPLEVGSTLAVTVPQDEDGIEDVVFTYTWQSAATVDAADGDWVTIQGPGSNPTGDTAYLVAAADGDRFIRVQITYTDNLGGDETVVTVPVGPVPAAAPAAALVAPGIQGDESLIPEAEPPVTP
ncbi:peroxidase family protein [Leucobacter denitrificans]|uniref:Cell wall-binding repeat-containing protein n=1 Tax=Leucobacter denitrificans TaxID=683042 RepID=A0A7G9S3L2_9MICO|nr:peroxidase family protein [Leucobacter denitrificans]QNN62437.1 cell wall-binding repeat-containing protein [Leucobacter denitrificans]